MPTAFPFAMPRVAAAAAILAVCGAAAAAWASDYSNECKSRDGRYVISDGALFAASDTEQKRRLVYAVIEDQVLARRTGYCTAKGDGAEGQRFGFESTKSRQIALIGDGADRRRAEFVCELVSDGLPAAYTCASETITLDQKTPGPVRRYTVGTTGAWHHNGSVMRLDSIGSSRSFVYMNPRDGLRRVGVSADMAVFQGERSGDSYTGTAFIFSKACDPQPYQVAGRVEDGEHRVVLEGDAPLIDGACKQTGTRRDTLVFELKR